MTYTVVTSLNKKYWDEISKVNIETWIKRLPENVNIIIYSEETINYFHPRITFYNLYEESPKLVNFIDTHKDDPHYNGTKEEYPRAFRYNGIKFAHKTFAIFKEAQRQSGYLIWLDADILMFNTIDEQFLNKAFPKSKSIVYLGRPSEYDECGVMGYNLKNDFTKTFLQRFEDAYLNDLDDYRETHDSWIFYQLRLSYEDQSQFLNLNTNTESNKHPVNYSILKDKMVHNKGDEKERLQKKFIKRHKL